MPNLIITNNNINIHNDDHINNNNNKTNDNNNYYNDNNNNNKNNNINKNHNNDNETHNAMIDKPTLQPGRPAPFAICRSSGTNIVNYSNTTNIISWLKNTRCYG